MRIELPCVARCPKSWSALPSCGTSCGTRGWRRPHDFTLGSAMSRACSWPLNPSMPWSREARKRWRRRLSIRYWDSLQSGIEVAFSQVFRQPSVRYWNSLQSGIEAAFSQVLNQRSVRYWGSLQSGIEAAFSQVLSQPSVRYWDSLQPGIETALSGIETPLSQVLRQPSVRYWDSL